MQHPTFLTQMSQMYQPMQPQPYPQQINMPQPTINQQVQLPVNHNTSRTSQLPVHVVPNPNSKTT